MRGFCTARVSLCSFNGTSADNTSARLTRALYTLLLSPAYLRARGTRPALKTSPDRITITVELLPFPIIILCYYDCYCILLLLLLLDICSILYGFTTWPSTRIHNTPIIYNTLKLFLRYDSAETACPRRVQYVQYTDVFITLFYPMV